MFEEQKGVMQGVARKKVLLSVDFTLEGGLRSEKAQFPKGN